MQFWLNQVRCAQVSVEEWVDSYVNAWEDCSDAVFEELMSRMRANLAAAGLEVRAVEEATEPNSEPVVRSTDSLTNLTVVTDCLHALHAHRVSFNVTMEAHSLLAAAPLTPLWCTDFNNLSHVL